MPRAKAVASAVLAIYADYPAGPERDAALAALEPASTRSREGAGRSHWDRQTMHRRQG
ncbi:MAG TPA: hypothetical protein VGP42_13535 [Stellaceae bacterium]|jgi:hypothetical protein|nr:hypothetical protein [Stellaceae bacterium]